MFFYIFYSSNYVKKLRRNLELLKLDLGFLKPSLLNQMKENNFFQFAFMHEKNFGGRNSKESI